MPEDSIDDTVLLRWIGQRSTLSCFGLDLRRMLTVGEH